MKKRSYIFLIILFSIGIGAFSQSFDVRRIFNSGATFGVEYLAPSKINNTTNFQMTKYKMQFVKVLRTKEVDLEDFDMDKHDAKANQLFLGSKFSWSQPNLSENNFFRKQFKAEVELIYITASKRRGVWFHTINLNAEENNKTFPADLSPNFRAYSVYIHAKNLKFVPFFGPGVSVTQGNFFVLPIFGFGARLNKNFVAELIFPIHTKLKYGYNKKTELELSAAYSGIHTVYREGNYLSDNDGLNLQQLKIHFGVNKRISRLYKLKVEFGYAFMQELDAISSDQVQKMNSSPFINFSFNYNFGNSILYKFFNMEKPKKIK